MLIGPYLDIPDNITLSEIVENDETNKLLATVDIPSGDFSWPKIGYHFYNQFVVF